jgi:hypothetical protein
MKYFNIKKMSLYKYAILYSFYIDIKTLPSYQSELERKKRNEKKLLDIQNTNNENIGDSRENKTLGSVRQKGEINKDNNIDGIRTENKKIGNKKAKKQEGLNLQIGPKVEVSDYQQGVEKHEKSYYTENLPEVNTKSYNEYDKIKRIKDDIGISNKYLDAYKKILDNLKPNKEIPIESEDQSKLSKGTIVYIEHFPHGNRFKKDLVWNGLVELRNFEKLFFSKRVLKNEILKILYQHVFTKLNENDFEIFINDKDNKDFNKDNIYDLIKITRVHLIHIIKTKTKMFKNIIKLLKKSCSVTIIIFLIYLIIEFRPSNIIKIQF